MAFIFKQQVAWGDMDAYHHLNNIRYYHYAQEARVRHIQQWLPEDRYTVIVATAMNYQHEVVYPDVLEVIVTTKTIGNSSITQDYVFISQAQGRQVATGSATFVLMDKVTKTKQQVDERLRQQIFALNEDLSNQNQQ